MLTISITCSFLLLISTLWNGYKNVCLFIYPLKNIWVISSFWQLWMKLLQTFRYRFLCEHEFLCLFVCFWKNAQEYICWIIWYLHVLFFKKTARLLSRVAVPFSIPTSRGDPVFHILTSNLLVRLFFGHNFYFSHLLILKQ